MNEGHLHVAEILVKNGADVNYRNKERALIPVTQVCIMWPMIKHSIMVNQWDVQGMSNKRAAYTGHSRHAYRVYANRTQKKKIISNLVCAQLESK